MGKSAKHTIVEGVDFSQVLAFPKILRAITMSFAPGRLALGLLMVVAILTAGRIWDSVTTPTVHPDGLMDGQVTEQEQAFSQPLGIFEATAEHVSSGFAEMMEAIVLLKPSLLMDEASELFLSTPSVLWSEHKLFTIVFAIILVIVLGIGGGTLSRLCACEIATNQKIRLNDGVDFAISSWRPLIVSLVLPLLIAVILYLVLMAGGWLLTLPFLDVLGGLLYPIALLLGFGITFLLIGYAFGFSLLVPAVACENCDAADAQQRAYHYFLTKPLHLIGYGFVALIGLAVGFIIASNVGEMMLNITSAAVGTWSDNPAFAANQSVSDAIADSWHSEFASSMVSFWSAIVGYIVAGYVFANFFSASTIVYMLMRRACDKQDLTEVWQQGNIPSSAVPNPIEQDEVL